MKLSSDAVIRRNNTLTGSQPSYFTECSDRMFLRHNEELRRAHQNIQKGLKAGPAECWRSYCLKSLYAVLCKYIFHSREMMIGLPFLL